MAVVDAAFPPQISEVIPSQRTLHVLLESLGQSGMSVKHAQRLRLLSPMNREPEHCRPHASINQACPKGTIPSLPQVWIHRCPQLIEYTKKP